MSRAKLIGIGVCCWWSSIFLLISVLLAVHEALNVHDGRGDSIMIAIHLMIIGPFSIALGVVGALKIYHELELPNIATTTTGEQERR